MGIWGKIRVVQGRFPGPQRCSALTARELGGDPVMPGDAGVGGRSMGSAIGRCHGDCRAMGLTDCAVAGAEALIRSEASNARAARAIDNVRPGLASCPRYRVSGNFRCTGPINKQSMLGLRLNVGCGNRKAIDCVL